MSGDLVSEFFTTEVMPSAFAGLLGEADGREARSRLLAWRRRAAAVLGPVSSARTVLDVAATPVCGILGFEIRDVSPRPRHDCLVARAVFGGSALPLLIAPWAMSLDSVWRAAVEHSAVVDADWCLGINGRHLRLIDTRRTHVRRHLDFDLDAALDDDRACWLLWAMLRAPAFLSVSGRQGQGGTILSPSLAARIVEASTRHTVGVCRSLGAGVLEALGELLAGLATTRCAGWPRSALMAMHEQALTIVYRILFLLFAESRDLVPLWHPVYRESYSIEAARAAAESPARPRGLWEALQAVCRLAHAGCRAGDLVVTPFNGRLFALSFTPLADSRRLDDEAARRILLALTTTPARGGTGRARILFRDLGVEQLGAVYEGVLDYRPALKEVPAVRVPGVRGEVPTRCGRRGAGRGAPRAQADAGSGRQPGARVTVALEPGSGVRKATGTFYTPRPITSHIVRRTLGPLVAEATPESILELKVLDPAMGSGAFLVAACEFLASAYEHAVVRTSGCHPSDIEDDDRCRFRRLVAQHCLYGVDRNPMAVQLARLSIWLATLAPDRPLSFLDHRLMTGDSLVGASVDDIARLPFPGGRCRVERGRTRDHLPLFDVGQLGQDVGSIVPQRDWMAATADESIEVVREKERLAAGLASERSPLARWRAVADLWCTLCMAPPAASVPTGLFGALTDRILSGRSSLKESVADAHLAHARRSAAEHRFFHWTMEFPEVFFDRAGRRLQRPGFDAVIGNPPWDMIRGDNRGTEAARARSETEALSRFVRRSGIYRAQGDGHGNLFQLFVERAIRLTRRGGWIGLVVPWGLAADHGSARLRRLVFDTCTVDGWIGFENSAAIFPIHRSVRFLVMTGHVGGKTEQLRCRLGARDPAVLDSMPDAPDGPGGVAPVVITRALLDRLSPEDLAVPDVRSPIDVSLLERIDSEVRPLCAADGWHAEFCRELNASDHREHFVAHGSGLPVVEGKHIGPFRVRIPSGALRIREESARRLLDPARSFERARLAYRDVASATNRLTLIAAIVPRGCVTVHTLFCLRTPIAPSEQLFLCGVLNSLVANYLVRLRVTTHVSAGILSRVSVPRPPAGTWMFGRIVELSDVLTQSDAPERDPAYVLLQAEVARLYGLTHAELLHVMSTFPLIEEATKEAILDSFSSRRRGG